MGILAGDIPSGMFHEVKAAVAQELPSGNALKQHEEAVLFNTRHLFGLLGLAR